MSTPVLPRTAPDVDTGTDGDYVVSALSSIDTLFAYPRKRDGTAMSEVGGVQSSSQQSEHAMVLDVTLLHETRIIEDDPGPTQVIELVGKKQKACDVKKKELADDVAEEAVLKMMQRMQAENDRREENVFSRLQVSLKSAAEDAVGRLSGTLSQSKEFGRLNWRIRCRHI